MDNIASPSTANASKSIVSPSTSGKNSANDESTATLPGTGGDSIKEKCKERIDNFKKALKKKMPLSDQLDMRDP